MLFQDLILIGLCKNRLLGYTLQTFVIWVLTNNLFKNLTQGRIDHVLTFDLDLWPWLSNPRRAMVMNRIHAQKNLKSDQLAQKTYAIDCRTFPAGSAWKPQDTEGHRKYCRAMCANACVKVLKMHFRSVLYECCSPRFYVLNCISDTTCY